MKFGRYALRQDGHSTLLLSRDRFLTQVLLLHGHAAGSKTKEVRVLVWVLSMTAVPARAAVLHAAT